MPDPTTPNINIPYPVGGDQVHTGPAEMQAIAQVLDNATSNAMLFQLGALSARPGTSPRGSAYFATDVGTLFFSDGSVWHALPVTDANPVGTIITHAAAAPITTAAGAQYVPCDGSSYSRTGYPAAFVALGTAYGAVDGSHFNVPDLRGRTEIGAGTGAGLTARNPGDVLGEERHVLTDSELASHAHGGATGAADLTHAHGLQGDDGAAVLPRFHGAPIAIGVNYGSQYTAIVANVPSGGTVSSPPYLATTDSADPVHAHGIYADGGNAAHNNMPPSVGVGKLIRIA